MFSFGNILGCFSLEICFRVVNSRVADDDQKIETAFLIPQLSVLFAVFTRSFYLSLFNKSNECLLECKKELKKDNNNNAFPLLRGLGLP